MKKQFTLLLLAAGVTTQAQQLSPQGEIYLRKAEGQSGRLEGYVYRQDASGTFYLPAMILTDGTVKATTLQQKGIRVHTQAGAIWTVEFPQATFPQLCRNLPGVRYIELDAPLAPTMDSARKVTRVDSVHRGYSLPKGYSGTGVVMGVLDVGFEYNHPAFYDTTYNRYRVRRVWEQKASSGTPPAGFSYGREYTDTALIKTAGSDNITATHGMHVAGIAAGSGAGAGDPTNRRYRGMAYNSDVVLVGITPAQNAWTSTGMSDIIDGMNYVYTYAGAVRKPAVVNLSWGCPVGPHDGGSLFSQACDNLTGAGKIFVLSGGNNGDNAIHLQKTMTATDTVIKTYFNFPSTPVGAKSWIDIWGESGQNVQVQLSLYSGLTRVDSTAWIPVGSGTQAVSMRGSSSATDTLGGYISASVATFNNKPRILLDLQSGTNKRLLISIKGSTGTVNAWAGYVYQSSGYYGSFNGGIGGAVGGNTDLTVSDMVTTRSALAVAAFVSKNSYTTVAGTTTSYSTVAPGQIAPFSSKGPTADGRIKPDIAGPGMVVSAPLSGLDTSYDLGRTGRGSVVTEWTAPNGQTYRYGALSGTSMSSPAVAGIVAMMLEADSSLTPSRIKEIIQQTAITDAGTGTIPTGGSPIWGAGKINAYAALQKTLATLGIAEITQNPAHLDVLLYPNPATGQSTLEYSGSRTEIAHLQLTDITGRRLRQQDWTLYAGANTTTIDWTGLPAGLYFVQLETASGTARIKVFRK